MLLQVAPAWSYGLFPMHEPPGGPLADLGLGLDGSSLVQQDLDDAHMTVPGSTVERGQLILDGGMGRTEGGREERRERERVTMRAEEVSGTEMRGGEDREERWRGQR